MGNIWIVSSCLALLGLQLCGSSPYNDGASPVPSAGVPWEGTNAMLASIAMLATLAMAFSACVWCYRKKDFSMFTNAPSSNSGSDVPEVLIPIEQQFSPLSIEASSLTDSTERGVHYSVSSPQMIDQRAHVTQNNNIQEDNNNGPISAHELENIENNNAAVYIISENENRNTLSEAIRTREMAIVRLTASRDSVVQFEPLPPNITPSTPTSPSNVRPAIQNINEVDQQQIEIVVNDFEDRWHHMKPNTIAKIDHVTILPAPTPQVGILSTTEAVSEPQEPRTSNLDINIKEKASSMTSSIISDKDALVIENIKSDSLTNLHGSLEDFRGSSQTSDVDTQSQEEINLLSHLSSGQPVSEIWYASPNRSLHSDAQNVEPWLKDVVVDAQDDVSYYQDVSDAIKNLDNILNSEKTSSSGSSHQASPSKDVFNLNGEPEMKVSGLVKSPGISNFQSIIEVFPEVEGDNVKQLNKTKISIHSDDSKTSLEVLVNKEEGKEHNCDSAASESVSESEASRVTREWLESSLPESGTGKRNIADNFSSVQISKSSETPIISSSALSSECVRSDIVRNNSIPSLQDLCNKVKCSLFKIETLVESNDCNIKVVSENKEECVSSQIIQSSDSEAHESLISVPREVEKKLEMERNNTTSGFVPVGLNINTENTASDNCNVSNFYSDKELKSDQNISSVTPDQTAHSEHTRSNDNEESEQYVSNKYDSSDENKLFIKSGSSEYMEIESPLRPSLVNTFEKLMIESSFTCNECGKNITNLSYRDINSTNQYMLPPSEFCPNLSPTCARKNPKINLPLSLNSDDVANSLNRKDENLSTSTPRSNNDDASPATLARPQLVVENKIVGSNMLSISSIKDSVVDEINLTDNKISSEKPRYCKDCFKTVGKLELTSDDDTAENISSVTIGPFENCTLDLFTGIKTYLPGKDVRIENKLIQEEERLAFSSTFNDIVEPSEDDNSPENNSSHRPPSPTDNNNKTIDFSLETWDRFLGNSFEEVSEENNFDRIFSNKAEEKKGADQKPPLPVSAVDDNANLCVAGPSSDNAERLQLRANAQAESRRRRQLMDFNSDITTKLAIAENENNLNIEYSGPILVEESIVNDLGDLSTDSNEEAITEMVRVHIETPNDDSQELSLHDSDLNKHIVISYERDDTINDDFIEVIESDEDRPETELESLKALRDELELKLPIAQACRPALEDMVVVQELDAAEAVDVNSKSPEEAFSSVTGPLPALGEMLISYQVPLSPIVEETCSEVSAYENDKIWCFSQHTDSSETYPKADYNLTDENGDLGLTLGSERSATNSSCEMEKTYVIKDTDTHSLTTEMTMSADSLNGNEEDEATLQDSPVDSNNVLLVGDEFTHTIQDQREHLTHTKCYNQSENANALNLVADYQQLSQVSEPSAFDNPLVNDTTQENGITSRNVDLNLKLYSPLSEVSKLSFVSDLQSSKVKTSKATSINSWCSNDTLFNVEEDFEDFTCTPNTTPTPGDFVGDIDNANDVHPNIPRHDSNSISPDSISDNRTYTNKTSVPQSMSTCTAQAYIQSHILDKRPSIELMRHSPCPDSVIEAAVPNFLDTTVNEAENILENSKISLHMTKLDSVDLECLDKCEIEADFSMSKSDSYRKSEAIKSPSSHHKVSCSATSTPIVPSIDFEDGEENYETDKKLGAPNNEVDNLTFTESFIDMQFDFLDRDDSDKTNKHIVTKLNEQDDNSISNGAPRELYTDSFQYLQFEHSVDHRRESLEVDKDTNVRMHNFGSFQTGLSPVIDCEITTDSVSTENVVDNNTNNLLLRSAEDVSQYTRFEHSAETKPQDVSVLPVAVNLVPDVRSSINCDARDASLQFSNETTLYTHFEHSASGKPQDLSTLPEMSLAVNCNNSQDEHLKNKSTEPLKSPLGATSEGISSPNPLDASLFTKFENSALEKPQELFIISENFSNRQTIILPQDEHLKKKSTEPLKSPLQATLEGISSQNPLDVSLFTKFENSALEKPQELSIISESFSNKQTIILPQDEIISKNSDRENFLNHQNVLLLHNKIYPIVKSNDGSENVSLLAHNTSVLDSPRLNDLSQLFINFERSAAEKPQDLSHFLEKIKQNLDLKTSVDCSTKNENSSLQEISSINLDLSNRTNSSEPSMYEYFENSALVRTQDMSITCKDEKNLEDFCDKTEENNEHLERIVTSSSDNLQYGNLKSSVLEKSEHISSGKVKIVPPSQSDKIITEDDSLKRKLPVMNTTEIGLTHHNGNLNLPLSLSAEPTIDGKFERKELKELFQNSSNEISLHGDFEQSTSSKPQDLSDIPQGAIDIIVEAQSKVDNNQTITGTSCDLSHFDKPDDASLNSTPSKDKDVQKCDFIDQSVELDSSNLRLCSDNDVCQYSNFEESALGKSQDLCGVLQNAASLDISKSVPNKIDDVKNNETKESSSQIDLPEPCANESVEETPEYAYFDRSVKDKPQDLSAFTRNLKENPNTSLTHTPSKCSDENVKSDVQQQPCNQVSPSLGRVEVIQSHSPNHVFSPADITFSGPASDDLMSTWFNQKPESKGANEEYSCNAAPETLKEWDSESDDSHNSSSSGEFIWKEGEREASLYTTSVTDNHSDQRQAGSCGSAELDTIEEECRSISSSSCSDDERSDEEVDFVPSSWDCKAEPTKSSLRNLDNNFTDKKKVVFKRQKYHCVYEYPREVTESEGDSMHSPFLPDYSTYSDWELMGLQDPCRANYDQLVTDFPMDNLYQLLDTSSLSNMATPDEDFFISSSTRPFESLGIMTTSSQFFPGRRAGFKDMDVNITPDDIINGEIVEEVGDPTYEVSKTNDDLNSEPNQEPKLNSIDFITPDSGMEDVTPGSALDYDMNTENLDTKPNSTKAPVLPYWDKQINRNRHFGTLMLPSQGTSSSESQTPTSPLTSSSSESPLSPQTLGGLRHTRDKLKLDLPPSPLNMHSPSILSGRYSNKDLKVFDFRNIDFNNLSKRDLVEKSNELRNREETPSDAECENDHENLSDNATNSSEEPLDNHSISSSDLPLNNENIITDVIIPTPTFSTFGKDKAKHEKSPEKFIFTDDKSAIEGIVDIVQKADSDTTDSCLSQQSSPQSSHSELLQKSVLPIQEGTVENKPTIEAVKGEGTLLDSGDEDSGIESSARTTLERNIEVTKV